jgi:hypothetical protein
MKKANAWAAMTMAVGLVAVMTSAAAAQDPANGKMLVVSETIQLESESLVASDGTTQSIIKRFLVPFRGLVRVEWKVRKTAAGNAAAFVFVESALESCIGATNQNTESTTFVTGFCALRVATGDVVQVWVQGSNDSSNALLKDVRLLYDVKPGNAVGKVLP